MGDHLVSIYKRSEIDNRENSKTIASGQSFNFLIRSHYISKFGCNAKIKLGVVSSNKWLPK